MISNSDRYGLGYVSCGDTFDIWITGKLLRVRKIAARTAVMGRFSCRNILFLCACILTILAFPFVLLFVLDFSDAERVHRGCFVIAGQLTELLVD